MCLAIPGRILSVDVADGSDVWRMGRVDFGGVIKDVSLACIEDPQPGQHVLVHAGVAISRVHPAEAEQLLATLREMAEDES